VDIILEKANYLLAFIDILGYKEIIKNNDVIKINRIVEILSENIRFKRGSERYGSNPVLNVIGYSDSILFTTEKIESTNFQENIEHLFDICIKIQISLIKENILSRGGISFGEHKSFKQENITYFPSSAYITAVELEKIAKHPIILVDKELLLSIDEKIKRQYLLKDRFDNYFLHYLKNLRFEDKINIHKFIQSNILKFYNCNDNRFEKYHWLEIYLNWTFSESINYFEKL
jgi:hypothetical protein